MELMNYSPDIVKTLNEFVIYLYNAAMTQATIY